jgi:3-dehydroshikimate dehydratase
MLNSGLVSITFRSLQPDEVIHLAKDGAVQSIEWGGDIHVPPGATETAREVGRKTREAGLKVAAYGSYYRLGVRDKEAAPFEHVLGSAAALAAPTIRVWAGNKGSDECSPQERSLVIADALRVAEMAARIGITICLEYHGGTLTDTRASVAALLAEMSHPNIEFLWQPAHGESVEDNVDRLRDVLPRLRNVHVFHWWPTFQERHPLVDGEPRWLPYVEVVRQSGRPVDFLLEFVSSDSPAQFVDDAATLRRFLQDPV